MTTTGLNNVPCTAKIRPFPDDTELTCFLDEHNQDVKHCVTLKDYAYPGSSTYIHWFENDRRTFRDTWVRCKNAHHSVANGNEQCCLPNEHRGNHAY